ncbi:glycogen/starch synthase [Bacteroidetes bacterium endosymbiont of Geopemphigus sp.]|uniref:glycogen/starch synthase n=1 Tax=Bacteroidetes bacterium endosymbiont of Geopemphigus sp. TaxID=2047937 RepID=UPI000CD1AD21|nr:glycogen/starch synthase [Bacteroidetes bacterium endosymbiont of Geopemphigus sp.]
MTGRRILYISSELLPYTPETPISIASSQVPKVMQALGNDVRIFMPRYGLINERKHQLHEVIRLSGMNLTIKDMDQPLIIKVASIPEVRLQVYFIDNEEYFKRKGMYKDATGRFFEDNDERILFFTKGVMETVKKLNWSPDIVHVHGWLGACIPLYLKTYYKGDPLFQKSRIITSLYNQDFEGYLSEELVKKIKWDGIKNKALKQIELASFTNLTKLSIDFSDIAIKGEVNISEEIEQYLQESPSTTLDYYPVEEIAEVYEQPYKESILEEISVKIS